MCCHSVDQRLPSRCGSGAHNGGDRRSVEMRPLAFFDDHRRRGQALRALAAVAALVAVVAPAAVGLARAQTSSHRELEARFRARGSLGAGFASTYIADLVSRERAQAVARLGGIVAEEEYQELVATFGFQAAVLLDGQGRVLAVTPPKPSLIGTPIAGQYAHLAAAVDGRVGVSRVVPSAAAGVPVLGFAGPYDTPAGRDGNSGVQGDAGGRRRCPVQGERRTMD